MDAPTPAGMVSMFDEHTTRLKAKYTLQQWGELDYKDRAMEVALRRILTTIESKQNEEIQRKAKQKK